MVFLRLFAVAAAFACAPIVALAQVGPGGLAYEWRVEPTGHGKGPAAPSSPVVAIGQSVNLLALIKAAAPGQELVFRAYAPSGNLTSVSLQGDLDYTCSNDAKKTFSFGGAGLNWYAKAKT